nr:putative ribonuclease H-like domain-containing protein [Tanacetum cinerariifolium]
MAHVNFKTINKLAKEGLVDGLPLKVLATESLRLLHMDLFGPTNKRSIDQSTICIVNNPVFHQRTKHIEIMHHFIRDAHEKNLIQVLKIHTDDNVADLLTKAFDGPRFEFLVVHIRMRDQDDWIVSSWMLYTKSTVHVLDLTNGKIVYMFMGSSYPIRAMLLERMLRHRLTFPPSYCQHVRVGGIVVGTMAGTIIRACTAQQMVFSSPWLTAKKESGSPLQTALVCNSNPLMVARLPKTGCSPYYSMYEELASPEQTATGKDTSNPFIYDAAGSFVLTVSFVSAGYVVTVAIYVSVLSISILLLREDLSRNLELTESTPSLGEDCWELLKRLRFVPTDRVIQFLLMALCVSAGSSSCDSAGHIELFLLVMFSFLLTDIESADLIYR